MNSCIPYSVLVPFTAANTFISQLPQWTGRRSRTGLPIYAYRVSAIQQCDLVSTAKSDPSLSTVFLTGEYAEQFVQPLCGRLNGGNAAVAHAMHIIDLKGVGVKHLWSLRSYLQKLGATATAHYPEAVEKIFVSPGIRFFVPPPICREAIERSERLVCFSPFPTCLHQAAISGTTLQAIKG